jgi:hypothetical protein
VAVSRGKTDRVIVSKTHLSGFIEEKYFFSTKKIVTAYLYTKYP